MERPPITPATKVAELLEAYPELEETLIACAPAFRRLRNPVLRRTAARVASLEQAAAVGGMPVRDLVAKLRAAVGQADEVPVVEGPEGGEGPPPAWLDESQVAEVLDAERLLDSGEVPLGRVNAALAVLPAGRLLRVDSSFRPAPLLEALTRQGHRCHVRQEAPGRFATFVAR